MNSQQYKLTADFSVLLSLMNDLNKGAAVIGNSVWGDSLKQLTSKSAEFKDSLDSVVDSFGELPPQQGQ